MADRPHASSEPVIPIRIRAAPPPPDDDWALFLDVDGCLLELAETPDAVVVPTGLVDLLARLQRRLGGALALVSGRNLATLDALFAPLAFDGAGLHGAEHRDHAGVRTAGEPPLALRQAYEDARRHAASLPGVVVEDKGAAFALHWRQRPEAETVLLAFAEDAIAGIDGYRLQHGKDVVELRPSATNKGTAIAAILETPPFAGRIPVFAGDDLTDESGFGVVNARGGMSVLIGERASSAATHGLADPAAVREWLAKPPIRVPAVIGGTP